MKLVENVNHSFSGNQIYSKSESNVGIRFNPGLVAGGVTFIHQSVRGRQDHTAGVSSTDQGPDPGSYFIVTPTGVQALPGRPPADQSGLTRILNRVAIGISHLQFCPFFYLPFWVKQVEFNWS